MNLRPAYPALADRETDATTCAWTWPPEIVRLQPGAIDLWLIDLDAPPRDAEQVLDAPERERAGRFRRAIDARRFVLGRAALRRVLAQYVGGDAASLALGVDAYGKPTLARGPAFNLSHSGTRALLAVCGSATVGVDIERVRPMETAVELASRFFAPGEAATIAAAPSMRRDAVFFRCWTRKEAVLKALGEGLQRDTASIDAGFGATERVVALPGAPRLVVRSFTPEPGWEGAVCVASDAPEPALRLRCFDTAVFDTVD